LRELFGVNYAREILFKIADSLYYSSLERKSLGDLSSFFFLNFYRQWTNRDVIRLVGHFAPLLGVKFCKEDENSIILAPDNGLLQLFFV
jgi:hypothetical protein